MLGGVGLFRGDEKKMGYTVNVTGETLVLKKISPGIMLGKSLLYGGKNSIFKTFPA